VAREIKTVGLYDLILQDVVKVTGKASPSVEEIREALEAHPQLLRDYKQINVEYNLSNIHLKPIPLERTDVSCKEDAARFNENLAVLRSIEKYTLDFAHSSTLVIIFSVEFFVLFSVQYLIVLMSLKAWQWEIYGFFALSVAAAWWYAKREQAKYERENARFEKLYDETLRLLESLEARGCVRKEDLWIMESDEHV
jgi:membrane protein implicated in regulation of membrane protease activity